MGDDEGRHLQAGPADVPAMPGIPHGEQGSSRSGPRILAPAGGKYFIGWQPRGDRDGGASFVVVRYTVLDQPKVTQQFPLTEDGWRQAWQALVAADAAAAGKARAMLAEQASHARADAALAGLEAATIGCVPGLVFLGGYAPEAELAVRDYYDLRFLADRIAVFPYQRMDAVAQIPYRDIEAVDIGGPGLVRSGGGFSGGGFGVAGAVEGMAIATVLNVLTTQTAIKTIMRIQAAGCELFLLCTTTGPEALRICLSRPLGAVRQARAAATAGTDGGVAASLVDQLGRLAAMLENGLLTREEFDRLKAALIAKT